MSETYVVNSGGIGFFSALTLIFITLKLLDKIDWGWIWIFGPLWIPAAIVLVFITFILIVAGIASLLDL